MLCRQRIFLYLMLLAAAIVLYGCSSTRHVPEGSYLLDKVKIQINDSTDSFDEEEMVTYLRQLPNHKMLWSTKFRLGVYNLSGNDTTKWWNRWWRKLGEPPVIYDSTLTKSGKEQLLRAMVNKGFLEAKVTVDTIPNSRHDKMEVDYILNPGSPHVIRTIDYSFPDTTLRNLIMRDSMRFVVRPGENLDRTILESQRELITDMMKNHGYYSFAKENITFNADTTEGSRLVDLTMKVNPAYNQQHQPEEHRKYLIGKIYVIMNYDPSSEESLRSLSTAAHYDYKDLEIVSGEKSYLRPSAIYENCFLRVGKEYHQRDVDRTYQALSRFNILKFISVRFTEAGDLGDERLLDAYILLTPAKSQSVSLELEGTNSEGDLGVAAAATYTHRNVGKGSETLTMKVRGAYESLSGNLEGLLNDRYLESSVDIGVSFPKFKAPFLTDEFKRKVNAVTDFNVSMTYQERPEYTRVISTAGWSYRWTHNRNHNRYIFTPIDVNYVYLPKSTYNFIDQIAPDNPLLRYSYEDHFIMRMGFSFYHTNKRNQESKNPFFQRSFYTFRANAEIAGNTLFLLSTIFDRDRDFKQDPYKIFGIHYSQYFKINTDYSYLYAISYRNSLAFHAGAGVGMPYGNSEIMPFEKRFYGGGANGVRGWDVRTLGPGRYPSSNSVSDFINQCGDIRLEASVELRTKLFWLFELGTFIDVGNIWTIHNYVNQPDGMFHFNSFYKEFAAAYGLGIRMDFNYFLIRFDLGMKAHNPAIGEERWPLIHPNWHRDSSFHFSIGYPF